MDILQYKNQWSRFISKISSLYKSLSPERVILLWVFFSLSCFLFFMSIVTYNRRFIVSVPAYGGIIKEGIIGTPRFINPVLSTSDQDNDLTALIYAGLTKKDIQGNVVLDMAQSITESDDKLHYEVTLKKNVEFHDGVSLTADDVIYTVSLIQNPSLKSPHRIEWEGITIEKSSDKQFTFSLKKPFPLFMDILTLGILPKHIWKNLTDDQISLSDYNLHAIGSGPYKIKKITTNSGIPDTFTLTENTTYSLGRPYIDTLIISTYQNEKYLLRAFENGTITRMHGISPDKIETLKIPKKAIQSSLLPRTFAIFFNPNKAEALSNKNVRQALQMAINKQAIVDKVLLKYGKVINDPYPFDDDITPSVYDVEKARTLLRGT